MAAIPMFLIFIAKYVTSQVLIPKAIPIQTEWGTRHSFISVHSATTNVLWFPLKGRKYMKKV